MGASDRSESTTPADTARTTDPSLPADGSDASVPPPVEEAPESTLPARPAPPGPGMPPDTGTTPPSFEISPKDEVAINGAMQGSECSRRGDGASITFRNDGTTSYRIIWLDDHCADRDLGLLGPGKTTSFKTTENTRWRLRNAADGSVLVDFTLGDSKSFVVTVH